MAKKYIKKYLNKRKLFHRTIETRGEPKQTFLIICEGEKTEPNYFKSFKVKSASIRIVGTGCNLNSARFYNYV
ncbi:RloB domain-containing protein [Marispirochaeta sp.]|uniref:RloB domain-containing protein n=1 Tax=Marispirochaeta sp. TaxID=2038653 RepID=UPI003748F28D